MQQQLLLICVGFALTAASPQQYIAFDAASASSTYSKGNLAGSPVFAAQQALAAGSGYWCSSGGHSIGQSVTWTGVLNYRHAALGVKINWAYAPGDVKVLTSSDGANFEESKCWQSSMRSETAFEESFMFDTLTNVKAVTIAMRSPGPWGYFGINSVTLIAQPGPFMLVSGITSSAGEQCVLTSKLGIRLEPCLQVMAAGSGGEVLQFDQDGQIVNLADGSCLTLIDGDTANGGTLALQGCSNSVESGDGRTVFAAASNGQLNMPRLGNYCLTILGDGISNIDVAHGADVVATSSDARHAVENSVDKDVSSYWASGADPADGVDVQLDFGATKQIKTVEIDWEYPPQAYELQVAKAGKWTNVYTTSGNNLETTKYSGLPVSGSMLRIRMTKTHPTLGNSGGHTAYGIKNIRVLATSGRMVVQDCTEAEENADARDKFFMAAVPEFDQHSAANTKENAAILSAAEEHLGKLLAELYAELPSLAACGFKTSFDKRPVTTMLQKQIAPHTNNGGPGLDDASAAIAAVAPGMSVDMQAFQALVTSAREALAQISR